MLDIIDLHRTLSGIEQLKLVLKDLQGLVDSSGKLVSERSKSAALHITIAIAELQQVVEACGRETDLGFDEEIIVENAGEVVVVDFRQKPVGRR